MNMQTTDQTTDGVAPESQRDSQQRLAMPREQEPPAERTKDAVRSGVGGVPERVPTRADGPLKDWPEWCCELPVVRLTERELKALPEYSCTLPDSYKRPISEGGRPWKRDLNFYGRFGTGHKWVRCEYIPDPDPKFLAIQNERVEVIAGGGGAELGANNGTCETKSGAQGHSAKLTD